MPKFMNFRPGPECEKAVDVLLQNGGYKDRTDLLRAAVKCLAKKHKVRL